MRGFGKKLASCRVPLLSCFTILAVLTVMAMFTGNWCWKENGYPTYALQANAWLQGRLDLGQDYPWLELAIFEGKYYVSFPPFPSYVLLPFALLFGRNTPDGIISLLFTLAGVWAAARLAQGICRDSRQAFFWTMFLFLGTGYLFISLTPAVWFFAQVLCFSLSLLCLYHASLGQGGRSLLCWACAVGCRPMALIFLPVPAVILYHRMRRQEPSSSLLHLLRRRWYWLLGPALLGGSYMALNWARFGNPLEFGHTYLPEFMRAPEGQFSFSYFLNNFPLLFRLPSLQADGKLSFPTFDTALFFLVDPFSLPVIAAFLYALFRGRKARKVQAAGLCVLAMAYIFILCSHRTLGGWQFGNRYFKDIMPWMFFGLLCLMPGKPWFQLPSRVLMFFGFSLNLLGTVAVFNGWI